MVVLRSLFCPGNNNHNKQTNTLQLISSHKKSMVHSNWAVTGAFHLMKYSLKGNYSFQWLLWIPCTDLFILYTLFQKIFILLLSSFLYFSFYHLPFVTLSTYFHIFISFLYFHMWFYLYAKFYSFISYLKMISARSKRHIF